jgi:hypothetical protein
MILLQLLSFSHHELQLFATKSHEFMDLVIDFSTEQEHSTVKSKTARLINVMRQRVKGSSCWLIELARYNLQKNSDCYFGKKWREMKGYFDAVPLST